MRFRLEENMASRRKINKFAALLMPLLLLYNQKLTACVGKFTTWFVHEFPVSQFLQT